MERPALMLPMGKRDYENGLRMAFLREVQTTLANLGWCVGIESRGLGDWTDDCFDEIRSLGGRITHHLCDVFSGRGEVGKEPEEQLREEAEQVRRLRPKGMELASMHLKPVVAQDPPADAGLERYNSPVGAAEMLEHIKSHISFLRDLNEAMDGILSIENVPLTNFSDTGHRLPTYLALRAGCWKDVAWLRNEAAVKTTFDGEHWCSAQNLLRRTGEKNLCSLSRWLPPSSHELTKETGELHSIAGYWLEKDQPPIAYQRIGFLEYIEMIQPRLFHLGAATRDVDDEGRINGHLPFDANNRFHRIVLDALLGIIRETQAIGAVVEVCGQLEPDKYDPWSPREEDDEEAKQSSFLAVVRAIEMYQKRGNFSHHGAQNDSRDRR